MPRIRSIRKRGETKNFLFPFSSPSFLFALSFSLARLCPILEHLQACTPLRRVGRETKRGSCITRSNLTQVEATRLGVYAEDRSKHLHFPRACFSLFFFFSVNQLNHRPFLSFYRAHASGLRSSLLCIIILRAAFTAIQRLTRRRRRRRVLLFPANG